MLSELEVHLDEEGAPLNSGTKLVLDGQLNVGYAELKELRKLNGKTRVLRHSVRAADASRCSAVLQPLVQKQGRWVVDASKAAVMLAPVVSLGSCVVAAKSAGTFKVLMIKSDLRH